MKGCSFVSVQRSTIKTAVASVFLFMGLSLNAQDSLRLSVRCTDKPHSDLSAWVSIPESFQDSTALSSYLSDVFIPSMQDAGFLGVSIDSLKMDKPNTVIFIHLGEKFSWGQVRLDSSLNQIIGSQSLGLPNIEGQTLGLKSILQFRKTWMDLLADNGYPFAAFSIDSAYFKELAWHARLKVEKGPLYHVDSIQVDGRIRIKRDFLERYLELDGDRIYRQSKINEVSKRLSALGFLKEERPWDMTFNNTGGILQLHLAPEKTNRIDFLAGLMPSNQQLGGKLLLTGEAHLDLKNAFGAGERVELQWQQIQVKSPRLQLGFEKPYVLKTRYGVDFRFDLLKKDSSFLTLDTRLGLRYASGINRVVKFYVQQFSSNLIGADTSLVKSTKRLPSFLDLTTSSLGLEVQANMTDNRLNPRKGFVWEWRATGGIRRIRKNNDILQLKKDASGQAFNFSSLYDTVRSGEGQFKSRARIDFFKPIAGFATIRAGIQAGAILGARPLINEAFQIGGIRTLRGFDEESIYATQFVITTLEYRYLLGPQSYLFGFLDGAYLKNRVNPSLKAIPLGGVGFGISLETKSGLFTLAYAAGLRSTERLDLRQSKIHFGFVSLF